ncbi:hypothetical protein U9M48_018927 [Paspalum notatum var. saurae]|uniref:Retrotransposon gag domain-containing protein n=1 Tax=Paspalum notatum var. saurae TaxID=547442 RepID=A0AAQ3TEM3_PASNO
MATLAPVDDEAAAAAAAEQRRLADEARDAEERRLQQETADAAQRRAARRAAALQSRADAAASSRRDRRRLLDDIARHEQALAAARLRLQTADAADGEVDDASDASGDDIPPAGEVPGAGTPPRGAGTPGGDVDPVAALHAQALGILNLRSLVPVVLDLATPNFSKWRRLLLLVLGKYALADHVLCDAAFPAVPHWVRMDLHVLSWLYSSISSDLFEIVTTDTPSARATWLALEHQFLGNRETRIVLVDTEFRTLCQGSLSVTDYCRRMKTLADSLVELGEPISDRLLTINVLRGIGERFNHRRCPCSSRGQHPRYAHARKERVPPASHDSPRCSRHDLRGTLLIPSRP